MTLEKAKKLFEAKGYTMTATEYKNNRTPLSYICPKHPDKELTITYAKLNAGQGCKHCGHEAQRAKKLTPFEEVKTEFESRGYKLLDTEYKDSKSHLHYICPKHPDKTRKIIFSSLKSGAGCMQCGLEANVEKRRAEGFSSLKKAQESRTEETFAKISRKQATPYSEIKKQFEGRGYTLLTPESTYKNAHSVMEFTCPNHPDKIASVLVQTFRRGSGCNFCAIDSISGENASNWNPNLTDEEREANKSRHDIPGYMQWIKEVFSTDHYTCQKCGQVGGDLEAHHKDGWHWCKERRFDVSNGATLCFTCHKDFHRIYAKSNNTEQQFEEWIN